MEWKISPGLTEYPEALASMAQRVNAIQLGTAGELVWLVEHPPLYTLGTSAKATDILAPSPSSDKPGHETYAACSLPDHRPLSLPSFETGRGGQVTYHGPGQRVVYLMLDLKKRAGVAGPDLRAYVQSLEQWLILTLAQFGITGFIREGRVGVWVDQSLATENNIFQTYASDYSCNGINTTARPSTREKKIAALGVRVQKWVTSHGMALNVHPDLTHYAGIIPCGISEFGVTSMQDLGVTATMNEVDTALKATWGSVFS